MAWRRSTRLGWAFLAALAGTIVGPACSRLRDGSGEMGSARLALTLSQGVVIETVGYQISHNGLPQASGSIDVSNATMATVLVSNLPAGSGYAVTMTATSTDGGHSCQGSAAFTVVATQTALVDVILLCRGPTDQSGMVAIVGGFDNCPQITGISASGLQAAVGGSIAISALAVDRDPNDVVNYTWSAAPPGIGTFANASAAATSFQCLVPGSTSLSIAVSDGVCGDSRVAVIPVVCTATTVGSAGASGAAGGGGGLSCGVSSTAACDACTVGSCSLGPAPATDGCCSLADPNDRALCASVYACFASHASACVDQGDPTRCFCGTNIATCFSTSGAANGACAAEVFAAAKTTDPLLVEQRLVSATSPLGRAVGLTQCRGVFCAAECAGDLCPDQCTATGAGGGGGMGGRAGAGGTSGASGAGGAGGASGMTGNNGCTIDPHTTLSCGSANACLSCASANCSIPGFGFDGCCGFADFGDRALCDALYTCIEDNASACTDGGDPTRCFCGTAGSAGTCFTTAGAANGVCAAQFLAAAKTSDPVQIQARFVAPAFPIGRAVNLSLCIGSLCPSECSGVVCSERCAQNDPPPPGLCSGAAGVGGGGGLGIGGAGGISGAAGIRGVGGTVGAAGMGGAGGMSGTGSTVTPTCPPPAPDQGICDACTANQCALGPSGTDGCCGLADPADQALCVAAFTCFTSNASVCVLEGDPTDCFCGDAPSGGVFGDVCFESVGAANGPCAAEVLAAAKTNDPFIVQTLFTSPTSPLGRAVNLSACRGSLCANECASDLCGDQCPAPGAPAVGP
jgi:hypothetical protein